jgi:hypothetical protein
LTTDGHRWTQMGKRDGRGARCRKRSRPTGVRLLDRGLSPRSFTVIATELLVYSIFHFFLPSASCLSVVRLHSIEPQRHGATEEVVSLELGAWELEFHLPSEPALAFHECSFRFCLCTSYVHLCLSVVSHAIFLAGGPN